MNSRIGVTPVPRDSAARHSRAAVRPQVCGRLREKPVVLALAATAVKGTDARRPTTTSRRLSGSSTQTLAFGRYDG